MNIKEYFKKNYMILCAISIISIVVGLVLFREIGKKDAIMVAVASGMLIFELYYGFVDIKKSILMFIISFPVFVTARKVVYFDLLFIKISYESIYITFIFLLCLKSIIKLIKHELKFKEKLQSKFILLVLTFIILAINSNMFSENILKSLSNTYMSVLVPVMFMLIVLANYEKSDVKSIFYALILSVNLSCFYGFLQIATNHMTLSILRRNRNLLTFGYHNVNIFSVILLLVLPIVLELVLYKKLTKKEKIFLYSSLVINVVAVIITFTRGTWIAFLAGCFIILVGKKYKKILYVLTAMFLLASKWIFPFILHRGQINAEFFKNESMMARLQAAVASLKMMIEYPFGAGAGTFGELYKKFALDSYLAMPTEFRAKAPIANYTLEMAHNLWLQIGVEFGIVASILFLIIIINRIKLISINYSENRGIFTSIMVYLIFSVLTGIEFDHKGVVTGTLIIWLIFGIAYLNNKEGTKNEEFS